MVRLPAFDPIDYLVIGHITQDISNEGLQLGGTVTYASLTARALGLRVGIVTSWGGEISLRPLSEFPLVNTPAVNSTTFENIYTENGRVQYLREQAVRLDFASVPEVWRRASIMHMGPIANELDCVLPKDLSPALLGITPQGWMRQRAEDGRVSRSEWENAEPVLQKDSAVVMSREDVNGDDELIEHMAHQTRILVVTEACRLCLTLEW